MLPGYRPPSTQWYNDTVLVLLLCVLVLPLGLYGLWKSSALLPPFKAIVVGCLGYLVYYLTVCGPM
ncbi:hypothetical protein MTX78_14540 [Hymenobacter tibetensis]|uniref:Uncharacterized protein n=1 Tax=Hymenobacter tibetensis TaxID=497967 RepID=A0ABY4CSV2_9BACT|nr:hypothetical protein [Hymenobacter tibetensis]UOG73341.1 hypothetical protein MTX78_14540 [Hymenobacter tibetensis]